MLARCPCGRVKVIPPYRVSTRVLWYCCTEHRELYPKPLLPGERLIEDETKALAGPRSIVTRIKAALLLCRISRR